MLMKRATTKRALRPIEEVEPFVKRRRASRLCGEKTPLPPNCLMRPTSRPRTQESYTATCLTFDVCAADAPTIRRRKVCRVSTIALYRPLIAKPNLTRGSCH